MRWGVFPPNTDFRARVTPGKRVFGIDIETCASCGGAVRIIACAEDQHVIDKILTDLDTWSAQPSTPGVIAPIGPGDATTGLFDRSERKTTLHWAVRRAVRPGQRPARIRALLRCTRGPT